VSPAAVRASVRGGTWRAWLVRNRVSIQDLGVVAAVLSVAAFLALEFDLYVTEGSTTAADRVAFATNPV